MTAARLVADFLSRDATRIWQACGAVMREWDAGVLEPLAEARAAIARATGGVDLGGALRPNSTHLAFALRKLDHVAAGRGCLCALYPTYDLFDPGREAEAGHVESTTIEVGQDTARYRAICRRCGQAFAVREEGGYHYAWFVWTAEPRA